MAKKYKLTQDGPEVQALLNKIDELKANTAPVSGETPTALESLSLDGVLYSVLTKAVNDLLNYYTKDDTYTKDEVATALANALAGLHDVKYTAQSLTDSQKLQARTNIGATAPEVFWATYAVTTAAEIDQAVAGGKAVACYRDGSCYWYAGKDGSYYWFFNIYASTIRRIYIYNGSWSLGWFNAQVTSNLSQSVETDQASTTKYPSTKAVADAITAAKEVFVATYGTTTYAEIVAAYNANKIVMCFRDNGINYRLNYVTSEVCKFVGQNALTFHTIDVSSANVWRTSSPSAENVSNRVTSFGQTPADSKYPSEKLVWDELKVRPVMDSTSQETVPSLNLENTANKSQDVQTDRESTTKYPSVKAVFDLVGKWGVVSQTQTWTGSNATGYDYTMSNLVYGLIPQANIDLYVSAGAVFNETTGYFELNGLTDISYKEMIAIYRQPIRCGTDLTNEGIFSSDVPLRTTLPLSSWGANQIVNSSMTFANGSRLEVASLSRMTTYPLRFQAYASFFVNSTYLREVKDRIQVTGGASVTNIFPGCRSLVTARMYGVARDTKFADSPLFSLESIVYLVDNAANTSTITITLHATAYARCQADTTEYTYNEQTYTGIIALATAKNITIASA